MKKDYLKPILDMQDVILRCAIMSNPTVEKEKEPSGGGTGWAPARRIYV